MCSLSLYLTIVGISVELIHSVESKSSGFISLLTSLVLASFEFFTSNSLQKAQSYWMNQSKPTFSEQHSREEDSQGWWPSEQSWRGGTCHACQTCCATALTIRSQPGGGQGVYIELEALLVFSISIPHKQADTKEMVGGWCRVFFLTACPITQMMVDMMEMAVAVRVAGARLVTYCMIDTYGWFACCSGWRY